MRRPAVILVAAMALTAAGCSSSGSEGGSTSTTSPTKATTTAPTTTTATVPDPLDDQAPPPSINGITVQGDTIWVASIKGDQILQVRRTDGAIVGRFATKGAGPDDVAVAPDGSVWSTGFGNGDVGQIADGRYSVITHLSAGINPIAVDADGVVWIGTYGPGGSLYAVDPKALPVTDEPPTPVAKATLPDINAFGILADGTIVAPGGGIAGPGLAIAIDPETGEFETVATGLPPVAAGTVDSKGDAYVLANITGEVIRIDVEAKTSKVVRTVKEGAPFDNLAFADDGTLYLSSFTAAAITEVKPDGTTRVIPIGS